jgi:hypothetical protein
MKKSQRMLASEIKRLDNGTRIMARELKRLKKLSKSGDRDLTPKRIIQDTKELVRELGSRNRQLAFLLKLQAAIIEEGE